MYKLTDDKEMIRGITWTEFILVSIVVDLEKIQCGNTSGWDASSFLGSLSHLKAV